MAYFDWEDGEEVQGETVIIGYVLINGQQLPVYAPKIDGNTPITAENLNRMQELIEANFEGKTIVDSGSNANGSYVKWDDGTMICWAKITKNNIAYNNNYAEKNIIWLGNYDWTFPVAFIDIPVVTVGRCTYSTGGGWGSPGNASNTYSNIYLYDIVERVAGGEVNMSLTAIGKWK